MGQEIANAVEQLPAKKSLLTTMASKYNMDPDVFKNTIKATVMPNNATNEQMAAFLLVANQYDLNPVTKEIHAFPARGGGVTPVVGIDGWINLAQRRPEFDGMQFEFDKDETGAVESCTCRVYRKDRGRPIVITEYMDECKRPTDPWRSHPRRMLRHKAAIQAIRYAFGFSGIKDEDDAEVIYANATIVDAKPSSTTDSIMAKARSLTSTSEPIDDEAPERTASMPDVWPKPDPETGELVDVRGVPWIETVHSVGKTCNDDGTWRRKRGVHQGEMDKAEAQYLTSQESEQEAAATDREEQPPWGEEELQQEAAGQGGPSFAYPDIRSAIDRSATLEMCDEAEDMLRGFDGPEDQRAELAEYLEARRGRIAEMSNG
jgi:phage recombination protein Bet